MVPICILLQTLFFYVLLLGFISSGFDKMNVTVSVVSPFQASTTTCKKKLGPQLCLFPFTLSLCSSLKNKDKKL